MAERATRERAPAKQQPPAEDTTARARTEAPDEAGPLPAGGPPQWAGVLRDRPGDEQRTLASALGARAGNAALQRFISTTITGSSRQPARKPRPGGNPRGPGKAGRAIFSFSKQGKVEAPIEEFSFGATAPHDLASGQASHKAQFQDISFVRQSDDLSPMFMSAESTNETMSIELHLTAPSAGGGSDEAFVYRFTNAHLSGFHQSGGAGSPTETLKAQFGGWQLQTPEKGKPPAAEGAAGTMTADELGAKHVPLHAVSWGASTPTDAATGQATGKVRRQAFTITKDMDASSTKFLGHLSSHKVIPKATFVLSGGAGADGKAPPAAGEIELQHVEVASIQQTAVGGKPMETIGLIFTDMEYSANDAGEVRDAPASLDVDAARSGKFSSPVLSWKMAMSSPTDKATGQASGKRRHEAFEITVPAGPATVRFLGAIESHEILKTAMLTPKSGPSFGLANAHVMDLQLGTDDKQQPTTTVKLAYQAIAESAGKREATDTWSREDGGGAQSASASAKSSGPTTPGPGKAGHASISFTKQGKFDTPIESFSFGGRAPHDAATGMKSSKTQFEDLVLVRQSDSLSPLFFNAEATNETMSLEVRLVAPSADGSSTETFTYTFGQARMTSLSQSGGAGSPTETMSLHFGSWSLQTPGGGEGHETPGTTGEAGTMSAKALSAKDIKLHAVSWGAKRARDRATGQAAGGMRQQEVSVTKDMDAESPKLLEHLQNNSVIPDAKLVLTAGGTIDLKNARVGSVVQSAGAARPVETVTLQFEDLDYEVGGQPAGEEKDANGWFEADGTKSGKWSSPAINWSWGMTTPHAGSGGGATGRRRLEEFQITLPAGGPAAAHALSALDTNEVLKTAKLIPKSGPHFDLSDANVSDIQLAVDDQQRAIATIKMVYRSISEEAGNRAATDGWSGANT